MRTAHLPVYRAMELPIAGILRYPPRGCARGRGVVRRAARLRLAGRGAARPRTWSTTSRCRAIGRSTSWRCCPAEPSSSCRNRWGAISPRHRRIRALRPRPRHDRRRQPPAALQSRHAGAARSAAPAMRSGTLVDIDVRIVIDQPWHLWTFLERVAATEFRITRFTTSTRSGRSPASRAARTAARCRASLAACVPRHAQLDHSRLRRPDPLFARPEPHAPRRPDAPGVADDRRGHAGGGAPDVGREPRLSRRSARHDGGLPRAASGSRCRCAGRGSPRRSKGRCRTCSGSSPAKIAALVGSVDDAIRTMALVEACYESSDRGGVPMPSVD